ncbi:FHA domain-containing protein [Nocardioides sp. InS609-2]|uniref:FHA domain-containing protein n=1 Tax=Nocardioides sp. InS609-2 TaxID=2760705 RepID=UPI0020BE92E2|nr:FHA domain-containing protein [Nocardioides sp. InS609-2]
MSNAVNESDASRRGYLPGSWYAAVGPAVTVLLPASAKARVAAVWEQVDDGAGFDQTLDALLSSGLRDLSDFVLVGDTEGATRILVRGQGRVSCDTSGGSAEVIADPGSIWSERTLTGVTGITVEVEPDSTGDELSVASGLVRVSRVTWGGGAVVGGAAASSAVVPVEVESERTPAPESVLAAVPEPIAEPEPVVEADPEPEPMLAPDDETGEHPEVPVAAPYVAPEPPIEPEPEPAAGPETVALPVEEGADHDGHTTIGTVGGVVAEPPGIPGQPPAPSVTSRPVAKLVFSSGETIEVDRAILIGRAPEARRFASTDQPQLVTVPSPNHEISSTHLEIRPGSGVDHGMSVATDLGSTNGTMLMQPGLPPEELQPGIAVSLIPGAIIDLGDGVTIQVTNP